MGRWMTGEMHDGGDERQGPDSRGSVIIEWPGSGPTEKGPWRTVLPSVFIRVLDEEERLIPAADVTVSAGLTVNPRLITADVAVYLDDHGEIIYDPAEARLADEAPATFRFLVSEMRVRQ
jgi:hypothetical protein